MKGKQTPRLVPHPFAEKLDAHINAGPGKLRALRDRFDQDKASTKKILRYFRKHGIISKGTEDLVRKHWVREEDDSGDYGYLVGEAHRGFRKALRLCAGPGHPRASTQFESGAEKFKIRSWRDGSTVHIRIHIPELNRKTIMYKVLKDPGFFRRLKQSADQTGELYREASKARKAASRRGKKKAAKKAAKKRARRKSAKKSAKKRVKKSAKKSRRKARR